MPNVHVKLGETGEVVVAEDQKGVISGEIVAWQFYVRKSEIDRVKISFTDTDAKFFIGQQPLHEQETVVHYDTNGVGHALIWGVAPAIRISS